MLLYAAIFALLVLLRYATAGHPRLGRQVYPIVLFLLFVFTAFRYEVGCDWSGYINQFDIQSARPLAAALQTREPLWWLTMGAVIQLGLPYPWINLPASFLFFAGIHVLARRQRDPLGFLVLLFPVLVINMPMSALRQAAAIGFLSVAFVAFNDGRLRRFLIFVLLAAGFHSSSLVFLLLAPLTRGRYTRNRIMLSALLALPGLVALLGSADAQIAFSRYVDTSTNAAGAFARVSMLTLTGLFFVQYLRRPWRRAFPGDYKLVSIGALLMIALMAFVPVSTVIADRLGYFFVPIQAMMFARIPQLELGRSRKLYAAGPYLFLLVELFVWSLLSWHFQQCYVPYRSWLLGFPLHSRLGL